MTPETAPPTAPYGTPDAPRVAVRGEARIEVDPEIARLGITVIARGTDRRTALEDLTRRNADVLDLVGSYGEAVEKLETGTFSVSPLYRAKNRGDRVHSYQGHVHLTAVLTDFTALGELATRLADLEHTRVDGPWWGLRPGSPAHAEARRQAVREAVGRAREYAGALGADLAALLELADEGAEGHQPYPAAGAPAMAPAGYRAAAETDAPALDLQPRRQTVTARVTARFVMTPPRL